MESGGWEDGEPRSGCGSVGEKNGKKSKMWLDRYRTWNKRHDGTALDGHPLALILLCLVQHTSMRNRMWRVSCARGSNASGQGQFSHLRIPLSS